MEPNAKDDSARFTRIAPFRTREMVEMSIEKHSTGQYDSKYGSMVKHRSAMRGDGRWLTAWGSED